MGSLSGLLQRPLLAASALAIASVSTDFVDKFSPSKSSEVTSSSSLEQANPNSPKSNSSWVSRVSDSMLAQISLVSNIHVPIPNVEILIPKANHSHSLISSPSPVLFNIYRSADLAKSAKPVVCSYSACSPSSPSDILYRWHLPDPKAVGANGKSQCSSSKSKTVVVLLGWLGAKQKHMKRYAEWYTSRGFHVITFTFPMSEVLSYRVGGKAEQDVEMLVDHLSDWMDEESEKNLVFHTFSNTGWLTYGMVLEKFQKKDSSLSGKIKGCIVDSAPVAAPDPQVFASGFSAAFLKKNSVATKGSLAESDKGHVKVGTRNSIEVKPALTEAALLVVLEKLFGVVLNHPPINKRITDVVSVLTSDQPNCPQLYIYSSADRVIPASYVESFIEQQKKIGREVRSCNFVTSPHVDHFRNDPQLYSSQLSRFVEDCVLMGCKDSS